MNPENQNTTDYPAQAPAPQPYYPNQVSNQPAPQVYGPQQYGAYPPGGVAPEQVPPKNNKKLLLVVAVLAVILVATIALAVFMNIRQSSPADPDKGFARSYDSPVGLLAGMQAADVKSGTFKLRASYVGDGDFEREGSFVVENGKLYFSLVTDADQVNGLLRQLYDKQQTKTEVFDAAEHGVTNYFTYDFASIAGYHYLYDQHAGPLSGFVPDIETAQASSSTDRRLTLTTACDAALREAKKQTTMQTAGLSFDIQDLGINKKKAKISFATMQSIDKAVRNFFDSCYDLDHDANRELKKFVDELKEDVTASPEFTFWQDSGVHYLDVGATAANTPFGGTLHFELKDLSAKPTERAGTSGSYIERRNQFGLAYSLCRTDPVVTRDVNDGYRFLREDPLYGYPDSKDTGYYCSTLSVPSQYSPADSIDLKTSTGIVHTVSGVSLDGLRGLHDLAYEIEKFNIENKRYPGVSEFRDMARSNMGSLTATTQARFADGSLVYTGLPAECVSTCNDYALSFVPAANVQVQRSTYKPGE